MMKDTTLCYVYYDLGLFRDAKDVEEFLTDPLCFLVTRRHNVYITIGEDYHRFITCGYVWYDFVTVDILRKYYLRAKKIYTPGLDDKEKAKVYYEKYLDKIEYGDLRSLMKKEKDYAIFLLMYLLMLKDNAMKKTTDIGERLEEI